MRFKVFHIQHKPIDLHERDLFVAEWKEKSTEIMKLRPEAGDELGWQAISTELDKLELELKTKYPCDAEWNIESFDELMKIVESYGTVSVCSELSGPVIYLMDLPAQQKVETNFEE
jgi:hypothetical protein